MDTSGPGRRETLGSEGTFRMIGKDLRIPDNLRERKESARIIRPDLSHTGSGTEDTSESSEGGKDGRIDDGGTTSRRCEGDASGREHEAGPSGTGESEGEIIVLIEPCFCVADKTNTIMGKKA